MQSIFQWLAKIKG